MINPSDQSRSDDVRARMPVGRMSLLKVRMGKHVAEQLMSKTNVAEQRMYRHECLRLDCFISWTTINIKAQRELEERHTYCPHCKVGGKIPKKQEISRGGKNHFEIK